MPILDQMEKRKGAQHRELTVREIDDPHDAEEQREAERDQDIDRAQPDAVDEHLPEDGGVEQEEPYLSRLATGSAGPLSVMAQTSPWSRACRLSLRKGSR